ncbi:hypothetical protein AYI68_g8328 [Smittium mucronatum]|uniref:Uncharacterized protein n=1 Tax=Smittium mucronatum TaxID=133383 RepID=A0A1R0GL88_9FUNG|nr:hypothetical protein AYI68_g8328 [Smittium mucronatum]
MQPHEYYTPKTLSPSRDFSASIALLLCLSTLHPLPPVLTKLSVCTAPTVGITGENLNGRLGPELKESPSKEDTRSSITGPPIQVDRWV